MVIAVTLDLAPKTDDELKVFVDGMHYQDVLDTLEEIIGEPLWPIMARYTLPTQKRAILQELIIITKKRLQRRRK